MTRIRFRTDGITEAELHRDHLAGKPVHACDSDYCRDHRDERCPYHREAWEAVPPAAPGDTWRLTFHPGIDAPEGTEGPLAGYAICCPGCGDLHYWSSAANCATRRETAGGFVTCDHQQQRTSCWTWTGNAEDGTLSAYASLHASRACGWHGWLTDGVLRIC